MRERSCLALRPFAVCILAISCRGCAWRVLMLLPGACCGAFTLSIFSSVIISTTVGVAEWLAPSLGLLNMPRLIFSCVFLVHWSLAGPLPSPSRQHHLTTEALFTVPDRAHLRAQLLLLPLNLPCRAFKWLRSFSSRRGCCRTPPCRYGRLCCDRTCA